jgi:hypothetical protein
MIGKAIHEMLKASPVFTAIPISPLRSAQLLAMPLVTYIVTDNNPTGIKTSVSPLDVVLVTINVFTNDYMLTQELGVAVRTAIDRRCGVFGGVDVQSASFRGFDEVYDDGAEVFVIGIDFQFRVSRITTPSGIFDYDTLDYSPLDYFTTL